MAIRGLMGILASVTSKGVAWSPIPRNTLSLSVPPYSIPVTGQLYPTLGVEIRRVRAKPVLALITPQIETWPQIYTCPGYERGRGICPSHTASKGVQWGYHEGPHRLHVAALAHQPAGAVAEAGAPLWQGRVKPRGGAV